MPIMVCQQFDIYENGIAGALHDGPVIIGGDFNCTLHPLLDRSSPTMSATHDSPSLRSLIADADLEDALEDEMVRAEDERDSHAFHAASHTYFYSLPAGGHASSRLDRWYVSIGHADWVRSVNQSVPGLAADHNGVTLRLAAPVRTVCVRKPRRVYPVATCMQSVAEKVIIAALEEARRKVTEAQDKAIDDAEVARQLADWWDKWKGHLCKTLLTEVREARSRMTQSYKHRLRRLQARLHVAQLQHESQTQSRKSQANEESTQTRESDAAENESVSVDFQSRSVNFARVCPSAGNHGRGTTTRSFFARVSTKFRDNTIVTLGGNAMYGPNRSRELADDMADGWKSVMQRHNVSTVKIATFLERAAPPRLLDDSTVVAPFNEEEVAAAIKKCKRGKAAGPDEIGNTFYRDYKAGLTPILAQLYARWLECGVVPRSFREANVQCIKKSAAEARPLEHRPCNRVHEWVTPQ